MPKKLFISYRHTDADWVWKDLQPCLEAAGATVLIDKATFKAGQTVIGQMDQLQDQADLHLLVITEKYLQSPYCMHEMDRAVASDPQFQAGKVIPIRGDDAPWPAVLTKPQPHPLYVDLRKPRDPAAWALLLKSCDGDLRSSGHEWLRARDEIVMFLERKDSVSLVAAKGTRWLELIEHLRSATIPRPLLPDLKKIDLESGQTSTQRGLLSAILRELGLPTAFAQAGPDLVAFSERMETLTHRMLALCHFDMAATDKRQQDYGVDLFAELRNLAMTRRKLTVLIHSHAPFASLLPTANPFSHMNLQTVELRA